MKRIFAKWWLWVSLTLILCLLIMMCAKMDEAAPLSFLLESPSQSRALNIYDGEDGNYYVFLPSYARLEDLKIELAGNTAVFLGDTKLTDGMDCGSFSPGTGYLLRVNNQQMAALWFCPSENVATMYIDTSSGSMARIHDDKNYKESAHVEFYTESGVLSLSDRNASINGRGNWTWTTVKKPYLLTLSAPNNIPGMGNGTKWVLLSNSADETNLRNKIVFDLGKETGNVWTPNCRFVDLYLNGNYNGLYLLAEKIEPEPERLNINLASGDFLCKIDLNTRWGTLTSPFLTNMGRTVEISKPQNLDSEAKARIIDLVGQLEQLIASDAQLTNEKLIDLDSWVHRYLIDEISGNIDADLASSYFYYQNGIFYGGPLWDYDKTFGNSDRNVAADAFCAKLLVKYPNERSTYYDALTKNESFSLRTTQLFQTIYLPALQHLIDGGIEEYAVQIEAASANNSIRWSSMFQSDETYEDIISYLRVRTAFLSDYWINGTPYCTLQFKIQNTGTYQNYSVVKGTPLETCHIDIANTVWRNSNTGEVFDFSLPVTQDIILTKQEENMWVMRDYITFASLAALGSLLLCFAGVDLLYRRKERKRIHERTHVSP